MTKEEVTLIAALIAASASLFSLFFSARAKLQAEIRSAQRASLEKVITELGNELYSTVAMSKRMGMATDAEAYKENKAIVTESARNIDQLRRDTRYFLWGLNDGIHAIVMLPKYVEFLRGNNESVQTIVRLATDLREELDLAIQSSYQSGKSPSKRAITKVTTKLNSLRNFYESEKNKSTQ